MADVPFSGDKGKYIDVGSEGCDSRWTREHSFGKHSGHAHLPLPNWQYHPWYNQVVVPSAFVNEAFSQDKRGSIQTESYAALV